MQGLNGQGNTTFSKKQLDHTAFDEKYNIRVLVIDDNFVQTA